MKRRYSKQSIRPDRAAASEGSHGNLEAMLRFLTNFQRFAWDIGGIVALAIGLMTLLALFNLTGGVVLTWWAGFLRRWLGWGSLMVVLVAVFAGIGMLRRRAGVQTQVHWGRIMILEIAVFTGMALLTILGGTSVARAEAGLDGGLVGWGLVEIFSMVIKPSWLLALLLVLVTAVAVLIGSGWGSTLAGLASAMS